MATNPFIELRFNTTESLPGTLYLIKKYENPRVGDVVAFYPPESATGKWRVFIKVVRGQGGDVVRLDGRDFYINGEYLATAKEYSLAGKALEVGYDGAIPNGHFFLWTPHNDSYDSRYADVGLIPESRVIGVASLIF
jgi:conjugal transfer pilin signal peptidase TrbI